MNDDQLRALVRESIARHLPGEPSHAAPTHAGPPMVDARLQASHAVYNIPRDDDDGPCVIEPSVPCSHCNYCKSHGH